MGDCMFFSRRSRPREDYLDMVAGIEAAVKEAGTPVLMEGDPPPGDPRLNKLAVTPDPGVIEVNLHPSATWDELVVEDGHAIRGGAAIAAAGGEVYAGRPPHRHRRRQPPGHRRPDAG